MKKTLLLAAVALALPLFAAAGPMKPGKWQVTREMEVGGMKFPPATTTGCVSKEEADNPQPPKSPKDTDCEFSNYKIVGNTVTWTMSCPKQQMSGSGRLVFTNGDSYDGGTKMKVGDKEVSMRLTGKRLGDCDTN